MTQRLIVLLVASLAATGCSSSSSGVFVDELSTSSQIDLCESFLTDYCSTPSGDGFCDDPCIDTACLPASENGNIDDECFAVFDTEVEDCGFTGDPADCTSGNGGCMIDALAAACNGV